ncbi:thioredoxin family protein [Thalassotalea sp. 1_MG-2023]|uniref:TlpA family protein disulfide reductase n=1 Tax=Thalassotalea sp. 1_MG-2023 TaxID=3062680 RepID=UPI0026E14259|nr:thioredoxin family protein [Thalassotalea sp. 1_MG-2023]MDO6426378.1 thioredoxin family protein [Thalassotalea sp. 1_MG-2023]
MKKQFLSCCLSIGLLAGCALNDVEQMAQGDISRQQLLSSQVQFSNGYHQFHLSEQETALVQQWPDSTHFDVYFGTWCHDSEREVPKLLKIIDANKTFSHQLIALNYQKTEPEGRAKKTKVMFTPTIIISVDDQEVGRIIERPRKSLVDDIDKMIKKHNA